MTHLIAEEIAVSALYYLPVFVPSGPRDRFVTSIDQDAPQRPGLYAVRVSSDSFYSVADLESHFREWLEAAEAEHIGDVELTPANA